MKLHIDPVCKMKVQENIAGARYEYMGVTYYFCAKSCMEKFKKEPEKFILETEFKKTSDD